MKKDIKLVAFYTILLSKSWCLHDKILLCTLIYNTFTPVVLQYRMIHFLRAVQSLTSLKNKGMLHTPRPASLCDLITGSKVV